MLQIQIETPEIKAEFNNGYCYVRNLGSNGGVIDSLIKTTKATKIVKYIISDSVGKTFSEIWSDLNKVKGVKFQYQSN